MQKFEYAVLGGSLLLSVGLLFFCILRFSLRKTRVVDLSLHAGGVETGHLGWRDLAGVGLIFVVYLGNWIDFGRVREAEELSFDLLLSQLVLQLGFIGVVLGLLFRRVRLVRFWGLRPGRYWWVIGVTFAGFVGYFALLELLWAVGFQDWTDRAFPQIVAERAMNSFETSAVFWTLFGLITVVAAPLMEEVVFRGYLYPVLKRMGGVWLAALTVSLFFAAAHLEGSHLLGRFLLSLILIAAYEFTGSLWAPLGIHFLNNFYVFLDNLTLS